MVKQRKHVWTGPRVLHRSCSTTPQGHAPAGRVVYLHAQFAPETFAPFSCNTQRTGSSRAALVLSFFAFLSSLDCHSLDGVEMYLQIFVPLKQQLSTWKCGSQGSTRSTPAGLWLCRAEPRTLVLYSVLLLLSILQRSEIRNRFSRPFSQQPTSRITSSLPNVNKNKKKRPGVVSLGAALSEELSHMQALASMQDYGWLLGRGDRQDVTANAAVFCYRLELHKLRKGEKWCKCRSSSRRHNLPRVGNLSCL